MKIIIDLKHIHWFLMMIFYCSTCWSNIITIEEKSFKFNKNFSIHSQYIPINEDMFAKQIKNPNKSIKWIYSNMTFLIVDKNYNTLENITMFIPNEKRKNLKDYISSLKAHYSKNLAESKHDYYIMINDNKESTSRIGVGYSKRHDDQSSINLRFSYHRVETSQKTFCIDWFMVILDNGTVVYEQFVGSSCYGSTGDGSAGGGGSGSSDSWPKSCLKSTIKTWTQVFDYRSTFNFKTLKLSASHWPTGSVHHGYI